MLKRIWILTVLLVMLIVPCAMATGTETACDHSSEKLTLATEVKASCSQGGTKIYLCSCGAYIHQSTAALAHNWRECGYDAPTCVTYGKRYYECTMCGRTYSEQVDKAAHRYGEWRITKAPTCTAKGEQTANCVVCGHTGVRSVAKLPHPFGPWQVTVPATDRTMGREKRSCTTCMHSEERDFYPAGTLYPDMEECEDVRILQQYLIDNGYIESRVDGDYGKKTTLGVQNYQNAKGYEATGVAYPQTLYGILCVSYDREGNVLGVNSRHAYGEWTVTQSPTIQAMGKRAHLCSVCGYIEEVECYPEGTLYQGMPACDEVRALQQALIDQKIIKTRVDGDYGEKTMQGVKKYQEKMGFEATGVAFPQTLEALLGVKPAQQPAAGAMPVAPERPEAVKQPQQPAPQQQQAPAAQPQQAPVQEPATQSAPAAVVKTSCEMHQGMEKAAESLLSAAETADRKSWAWTQVRGMWADEMNLLYDELIAKASGQAAVDLESARSAFVSYLASQEKVWAIEGDASQVQEKVVEVLKQKCMELCELR